MPPKREDYGWQHGQIIGGNRFHWKCNYCDMKGLGGGVTRLKKHIAGGFSEVSKCPKVPQEIRHAMKIELESAKIAKKKARDDRDELDKRAAEYPPTDPYEGTCDDFDADTRAAMEASRHERWQQDEIQRHRAQFGRSHFDVGGGSGPSGSGPAQSGLARSSSVSRVFDRFKKGSKGGSGRHPNIIDIDPMAFPEADAQQPRIDTMLKKDKKGKIGRAIAKFFHFNHIPPHTASTPYYRSMIAAIQKEGPGVEPPTSYEIAGKYLDAEVDDIHTWVKNFKQQWEIYGVTLMCDGWTGPTKMSIINFLIYCNGKVVFHKSVDAIGQFEDADYIYALLEQVLREVGEKYVVQVISDNGANFKRAGKLLMQRHPHLFWTPCAAHCINLMMSDFGELNRVKKIVDTAQRVSKYLYNHLWVHALMVKFTGRELVRPGITRFATNFIALNSILQNKNGLKSMFASEEWQTSRYASTVDGKSIEQIILSSKFWDYVKEIVDTVEPLYVVLRLVDQEKIPQMGHVYYKLRMARENIKKNNPLRYQSYLNIIDRRWDIQMSRDLHLAGYYLNPSYHHRYNLGFDDELLKALRNFINRLERDPTHAALAINEEKLFRESSGTFAEPGAINGRHNTDPTEWWLQYGGSTKHLKKIAVRVLSQTTTSSGCERNWSTFALIHTKARNRLAYARLEKLVYVHYNMRLRLRCMQEERDKERELKTYDPLDASFINDESDPILDWLQDRDNQEDPLLDEPGDPPRPFRIIAEEAGVTDTDRWADENIGISQGNVQEQTGLDEESQNPADDSDAEFERLMQGPGHSHPRRTQSQSGKGKSSYTAKRPSTTVRSGSSKKSLTSMDPLDAADALPQNDDSDTSTPADSGLPQSKDECSDDDDTTNGSDDGADFIPPTQQEGGGGLIFTEEQDFTHATQDADHGSRPRKTSNVVYDRRKGKTPSQQDYKKMREGLETISTKPPRRDDTLPTQSSYPSYQYGLYGGIFDYDQSIYGTQSDSQSISHQVEQQQSDNYPSMASHSESSYGESTAADTFLSRLFSLRTCMEC